MEVVTMGKECWRWDVFLPADWRAKDAARLAAGKETRWADDDDVYIAVYAGYLQALAAGTTEPPDEAAAQLAVIRAACELAERNDPLKWEVQARLLARQTDEEIAACVHRASEVINWFEQLFFNVRPRLGARMWIANQIIGNCIQRGFRDDELGRLWASFGYHGGAIILNALADAFYAAWRPGDPATVGVYFRDECPATLEMLAAIAIQSIPYTDSTIAEFCATHARLQQIKAGMPPSKSKAAKDRLKREIIRLWQSTRVTSGDVQAQLPTMPSVEYSSGGKAEVHALDESCALTYGGRTGTPVPQDRVFSRR